MHGWELATIAVTLLVFAAASGWLRKTPITAAMVFVTVGYLVGSDGLGLVGGGSGESTVKRLAEATLAVVLFADASRIDLHALRTEYQLPVRLLGIGLPLTILVGGVIALALFGALSVPEALIIAVMLAPTDAALGQAVVTDSRLPSRIRQGLNVESGLNDGICVPVLYILLAVAEADAGDKNATAALQLIAEAIGYGALGGVVAGVLAAFLVNRGRKANLIDPSWLQLIPVAAAALAYGIATPLGGSGFIAAFVGGLVYGAQRRDGAGEDTYLAEQLGEALNGVTFILFGAAILGPALDAFSWEIGLYAILSLTVVRMVPVALAMERMRPRRPTVLYVGWFGPRGLASIVFALIVVEGAKLPGTATILAVTFVTVVVSVFAHGLTAQVLTDRYVRWFRAHPPDQSPPMESVSAPHQRWRRTARVHAAKPETST
jgi:sodium/hydrogen antiporter